MALLTLRAALKKASVVKFTFDRVEAKKTSDESNNIIFYLANNPIPNITSVNDAGVTRTLNDVTVVTVRESDLNPDTFMVNEDLSGVFNMEGFKFEISRNNVVWALPSNESLQRRGQAAGERRRVQQQDQTRKLLDELKAKQAENVPADAQVLVPET